MSVERQNTTAREIQFLVMPDPSDPWLLARVRWPDVFQAISAAEPEWRSDPGLFDLPYDPCSTLVDRDHAAAIAAAWGAEFPSTDEGALPGPDLIRRMPANWSELSPAARHAWSIEPRRPNAHGRAGDSRGGVRRRRRKENQCPPGLDASTSEVPHEQLIVRVETEPSEVIDLTDTKEADIHATVEDS